MINVSSQLYGGVNQISFANVSVMDLGMAQASLYLGIEKYVAKHGDLSCGLQTREVPVCLLLHLKPHRRCGRYMMCVFSAYHTAENPEECLTTPAISVS